MNWLRRPTTSKPSPTHRNTMRASASAVALLGLAAAVTPACLSRPIEPIEPKTTSMLVEKLTQNKVDKIDILLGIDDSISMADKQSILALAVPDLIDSLVNPDCVDDASGQFAHEPDSPLEPCPEGSHRQFDPVLDIHIGIISTSLGAHGSDAKCSDDNAQLLDINGEPASGDLAYLAWDPEQQNEPPGYGSASELGEQLHDMVVGVGQQGCGYEAQLESWYRFLVDPEPYAELVRPDPTEPNSGNELVGVDEKLLAQRAAFLRPDSLVAIVMLSDENDCSFRAEGRGFWTTEPKILDDLEPRAECAKNPNDPCCAPCGHAPSSCPTDPTCTGEIQTSNALQNLSCWDQKRRFGVDLLYPVERYINGLTQTLVPNREGDLVDNPLLVSHEGGVRHERPRDRVFLTGIVGVPWQNLARRGPGGAPNLAAGLKTAGELAADGVWDVILGDPAGGVAPTDPHMRESRTERMGHNPITDDAIAPSTSADPWGSALNGHEYNTEAYDNGELQYACIFDLREEDWIECGPSDTSCDCQKPEQSKNPLCQAPDGSYSNTQRRAKAKPGLRQLEVLEGIGDQAIVASICAAQITDDTQPDFGYQPAIGALVDRLSEQLQDPCLQRSFTPDEHGHVACVILEGTRLAGGEVCDCAAAGRQSVRPEVSGAEEQARLDTASQLLGLDCFCEIPQVADEALQACQNDVGDDVQTPDGTPVDGWCYVDASTVPVTGNPQLVDHCPATQQRTIRFANHGAPTSEGVMFITCQQTGE